MIKDMIIILTWPSGSWKTTIQQRLVEEEWWAKPYNFTTRECRTEFEYDDYIFVPVTLFQTLRKNNHFIENTEYKDNFYAISHYNTKWQPITHSNTVVIMEPNGRNAFIKELQKRKVEWIEIFLQIDEETLINRLNERGDEKASIEKRKDDVINFFPTQNSHIVNATKSADKVYKDIISIIKQNVK